MKPTAKKQSARPPEPWAVVIWWEDELPTLAGAFPTEASAREAERQAYLGRKLPLMTRSVRLGALLDALARIER